jgi:hypothetical protein
MMHEIRDVLATAIVDRLLERIEHEVGRQRRRHPPAHDPSDEHFGSTAQIGSTP